MEIRADNRADTGRSDASGSNNATGGEGLFLNAVEDWVAAGDLTLKTNSGEKPTASQRVSDRHVDERATAGAVRGHVRVGVGCGALACWAPERPHRQQRETRTPSDTAALVPRTGRNSHPPRPSPGASAEGAAGRRHHWGGCDSRRLHGRRGEAGVAGVTGSLAARPAAGDAQPPARDVQLPGQLVAAGPRVPTPATSNGARANERSVREHKKKNVLLSVCGSGSRRRRRLR